MLALLIALLLAPQHVYTQNVVELLRPMHRAKSAIICRNINVPMVAGAAALRVAQLNMSDNCYVSMRGFRVNVALEREILANSLKNPIGIYGPYKYTKAFSKAANNQLLVNTKWQDNWKHINTTGYYNGAHHLINKSTIKMIYKDLKAEGMDVRLNEMEANAPAIFHPLHGDTEFRNIFHDSEQQYYDYKRFGMKVTIISLLARIDELNLKYGLGSFSKEYLEGILKEAELWCRYWGCCCEIEICH